LFVAPTLLGAGLSWCAGRGWPLARAPRGTLTRIERLGTDALLWMELEG
jgi:riboflavin biosynthesis pyrimidine reductase